MTGQLFITEKTSQIDKHTHLELFFSAAKHKIIYRDIRKFGGFELIDTKDIPRYLSSRRLAPDALEISFKEFYGKLKNKNKGIKATLLDQTTIAGLGNIYVDEVLIREKISPNRTAGNITEKKAVSLLKTIKKVLKAAILKKGTSFSDYVNSYGEKGKFQLALKAYQQKGKPCMHCQTAIKKTKVAGRGTYYCPACQKK
jgi:formamidopyrimidine-DNA glycosylase